MVRVCVYRGIFIYFKFINTITHLFSHFTRFVSCYASYQEEGFRRKKKNVSNQKKTNKCKKAIITHV